MFASTLIPTLVHFIVFGSVLMFLLTEPKWIAKWRMRASEQFNKDPQHRFLATLYLTFVPTVGIYAPLAFVSFLLFWLFPQHGKELFDFFVCIASWTYETIQ